MYSCNSFVYIVYYDPFNFSVLLNYSLQCFLTAPLSFTVHMWAMSSVQCKCHQCSILQSSLLHILTTTNTLCLKKNDNDVAHSNFNTHKPILIIFLHRCCWVSTLLNGDLLFHLPLVVSLHYLGKHEPRNLVFSVMLYTENNTDFACYILHIHQSILIIFGRK